MDIKINSAKNVYYDQFKIYNEFHIEECETYFRGMQDFHSSKKTKASREELDQLKKKVVEPNILRLEGAI